MNSQQNRYIPAMSVGQPAQQQPHNSLEQQYAHQAQSQQFINQMLAKRNKQMQQQQQQQVMHGPNTMPAQPQMLSDGGLRPNSVVNDMISESDLANLQVQNNAQSNFTQGGQQPRWSSSGQRRTQGAPGGGRSTSQSNHEQLQNSNSRSKKQSQGAMSYQGPASNMSYGGGTNTSRTNMSSNALQSSQGASNQNNFKVVVRLRPPLQREKQGNFFFPIMQVGPDNRSIACMEYFGREVDERERAKDIEMNPHLSMWHTYSFDHVYDMDSTQEHVYDSTAKHAVQSVLEGYNATILAYGQTGTGKTHTMEGFKYSSGDPHRGIIPRSMEEIFNWIQLQTNQNTTFMVRASYLQIYNEVISDLLKVERTSLQIREDRKKGVFVEGLSEWAVRSPNEIYSLMQRGALSRATASTKMNDLSSRSHAVFLIIVEQMSALDLEGEEQLRQGRGGEHEPPKAVRVGKLNLVDLAGCERVRVTGATGKRLDESKKINQSLSALGNVIKALTEKTNRVHIPFRDSKLTRLLEDSLGGNCKTTMIAMVSPASDSYNESHQTLKFATRAKKIKNEARINEDVDQRTLLRKYQIELKKLKQELDLKTKSMSGMSNQNVAQLEAEKKQAEADKNAAINALEIRSHEFLQAQEEKRSLEEKIKAMNSQILPGGKKIEDTPQFRTALEEQQKRIRQEYEAKLNEIERERTQIEEGKAQVDRYKQLLLKQRDIMIALTSRLNERDETIIQLQEELDAYDRITLETESCIEAKQARIQQLEAFIREECGSHAPQNPFEHPDSIQTVEGQPTRLMNLGSEEGEQVYEPHSDNLQAMQNSDQEPRLLTSKEKVTELNSLLEEKSLENEEIKIQMQAMMEQMQAMNAQASQPPLDHMRQPQPMPQAQSRAFMQQHSQPAGDQQQTAPLINSVQQQQQRMGQLPPQHYQHQMLSDQASGMHQAQIQHHQRPPSQHHSHNNSFNNGVSMQHQPPHAVTQQPTPTMTGGNTTATPTNMMGSTHSSHSTTSNATNPLSLVSASVPTSVSEMLRQRHMQRQQNNAQAQNPQNNEI